MGGPSLPISTRAGFSLPGPRTWAARERSEGVFFGCSAQEQIGPFPRAAAEREAARQNETKLVICLAEAIVAARAAPGLTTLTAEARFAGAEDPRLATALLILCEEGDVDEVAETEEGRVALVDRFLLLVEPGGVRAHENDSPEAAQPKFEALREEG